MNMTDYKDTLNLPKTSFAMKANLPQREPEILARWEAMDLYGALREHCKDRPKFIYHDGPPYANARPHMGTALNKTLKDIVCKSQLFFGYDAAFVPGWDCHGLPIELNVEKKVGKVNTKLDAREFRQACRDYAIKQVDLQKTDFKRMGVLADWNNPYLTMDFSYEANTVRALAVMIDKGHLHKGEKPVHWCPLCASALAEAEVEYKDKVSPAIDVAFVAPRPETMAAVFGASVQGTLIVPIWTTTPWTLPANRAVALHADVDYVLVQAGDKAYVVADDLHVSVMARYGLDDFVVLGHAKGAALENSVLAHPFEDREVPIILGDHVTTEAGTGCVHTAPAHGQDDFVVGQHYGLPVENPVNSSSCFIDAVKDFAGMHVYKANDPIIDALKARDVLLAHEDLEHSYPHCWRHKKPLIFRATPQWFISMDKKGLRGKALAAVKKTQWQPTWGENRISKMVEMRPDWCISRQRTWGTPITIFVHKDTGALHPETLALMETVAGLIEKSGVQAWYDLDAATVLGDEAKNYDKVTDILDVWFDSGVSHYCVMREREGVDQKVDLYLEGSDQHRGWFQSSLMTGVAMFDEAPFKEVVTHGFIVDSKGHKMSKSLGNTVLPHDIISKSGADVMRLWIASTDYQNDIRFSDETLKRAGDAYRRIRNTVRFLLSNLDDFNPQTDCVPADKMVDLDKWAVHTARNLQETIVSAYKNYEIHTIYQAIHNFCAVELGSFYLDIIKDRQYTAKADGLPRRSSQTAMYHILEGLVRWLAPIISFTAEEVWACLPGAHGASVFFETWYDAWNGISADLSRWSTLMQVRDEVNKVLEAQRANGNIRSSLDASVTLYAKGDLKTVLEALGDELRFVLITSDANVIAFDQQASAEVTALDDLAVHIDVTSATKCERCWQRRQDVGSDEVHPALCSRCVNNVSAAGECRRFA
jgi:isoleucyl-tRNA synthetase